MEGSLEGSHGDRVHAGDGVGHRGGLHHYQGLNSGLSAAEAEEMRRLRRENLELRRANEILRKASAFFAAELDRPTTR